MSTKSEEKSKLRPWSRKDEDQMAARIKARAERPKKPMVYRMPNGVSFVKSVKPERLTWKEARKRAVLALKRQHFPRHWGFNKPYPVYDEPKVEAVKPEETPDATP